MKTGNGKSQTQMGDFWHEAFIGRWLSIGTYERFYKVQRGGKFEYF